jgi:phage tail sheath protein FI
MPVTPTYPGVYIVELPSPVRTIVGVSTSITVFIGEALKGPTDNYELIHNFADYNRVYGDLWTQSKMSYAVNQYFLNGGQDAIIIRVVGKDATKAVFDGPFPLQASSEGKWAEHLNMKIDNDKHFIDQEIPDKTLFTFNVTLQKDIKGSKPLPLATETYYNLSIIKDSPRFFTKVLNDQSDLVRGVVEDVATTDTDTPPPDTPPPMEPGFTLSNLHPVSDGDHVDSDHIIGSSIDPKSGLGLLDKVDLFNMLCIPPYRKTLRAETTDPAVYTKALEYCDNRRAILIIDPPADWVTKEKPRDEKFGIDATGADGLDLGRDKNAAIWFPRIRAPDPLEENRLSEFVPCGVIAGVIARTDTERGVWKAPAGIEATLKGVSDLTVHLTDDENGDLNPLGINCLRILPAAGLVAWGARTLRGADRLADQWKYLPVRRTALYIEESLYRGTQWVVFEPNDEPLWAQIRLNVGAFMHDLFRKGAFQGTDPKKAYFVRCDSGTTTQYDIDRGIVNVVVGFAPLKPAEFVVLQIQQIANQEQLA